jgi:hypothetical protein
MNIPTFGLRLIEFSHNLAMFLILISLAVIPFAMIVSYVSNRGLAAAESERDELGCTEDRRRFRPAVLSSTRPCTSSCFDTSQ